jgi:hypothetical protein
VKNGQGGAIFLQILGPQFILGEGLLFKGFFFFIFMIFLLFKF